MYKEVCELLFMAIMDLIQIPYLFVTYFIFKPGAPDFLKLILYGSSVCVFVCVCVCVSVPEAINN